MKILIDIDGVLCNLHVEVAKQIEAQYGVQIEPAMIDSWDYSQDGISFTGEIRKLQRKPGFLLSLIPAPGAKEGLRELSKCHQLTFATGRPAFTSRETSQWIHEKFGLCLPITYGRESKKACADVLIDDNPAYLTDFLMHNTGTKPWSASRGILFSMPWNELFPRSPRVHRARGWPAVLKCIRKMYLSRITDAVETT